MDRDSLRDRGRALEDSFFAKRNQDLLAKLRADAQQAASRDAIRDASGIDDPQVLDQLVQLQIAPETIAAFTLIPLVIVAWADGQVSPEERDAVLEAAHSKGFVRGNPSHELIERWLEVRPPADLLAAWKAYTQAKCQHMDESARAALRDDVLGRAREVARAAGGILGINSISREEQAVLDDLAASF